MWKPATALTALAALIVLVLAVPADAQRGRGGGMGRGGGAEEPPPDPDLPADVVRAFAPRGAKLDDMRTHGLLSTGLEPVYPPLAACPEINSPFAADTRGDGSPRNPRFFKGLHSGADIPVDEGTPILAVADGTVVQVKAGSGIGGLGMVLQHAPADTGLPVWTYTEYKHLRELPPLKPGQRVKRGQTIAFAGKTGTQGGYYGEAGHPHLHIAAYFSPRQDYVAKRIFVPMGGQWMDILALFRGMPLESLIVRELPAELRRVPIPYVTVDGHTVPPHAKVTWPFICPPR